MSTRKTPAKKASAKKATASKTQNTTRTAKASAPMDATVIESLNPPTRKPNNQRDCYAIETLADEVLDLFPGTEVQTSNYTILNTAVDVQFAVGEQGDRGLLTLLSLLPKTDGRVLAVEIDEEDGLALVRMRPNLRTQDSRESFALSRAWEIICGVIEEDEAR